MYLDCKFIFWFNVLLGPNIFMLHASLHIIALICKLKLNFKEIFQHSLRRALPFVNVIFVSPKTRIAFVFTYVSLFVAIIIKFMACYHLPFYVRIVVAVSTFKKPIKIVATQLSNKLNQRKCVEKFSLHTFNCCNR